MPNLREKIRQKIFTQNSLPLPYGRNAVSLPNVRSTFHKLSVALVTRKIFPRWKRLPVWYMLGIFRHTPNAGEPHPGQTYQRKIPPLWGNVDFSNYLLVKKDPIRSVIKNFWAQACSISTRQRILMCANMAVKHVPCDLKDCPLFGNTNWSILTHGLIYALFAVNAFDSLVIWRNIVMFCTPDNQCELVFKNWRE